MSTPLEFCRICWKDVECTDFGRLNCSCGHGFCRSCLCAWLKIFETPKGLHYTHTPSCPTCRQTINDWDTVRIMGRPFKRPRPHQIETPPSPREDQLFLDWLAEQGARQCPTCQMWVLRECGCDHMMCRCGQSFCYHCGEPQCNGENREDDGWQSDDGSCWGDGWDDLLANGAGGETEYQFFMDGMKASFGGKSKLLWKGNKRSQNQRRKKGGKRRFRKGKRCTERAAFVDYRHETRRCTFDYVGEDIFYQDFGYPYLPFDTEGSDEN